MRLARAARSADQPGGQRDSLARRTKPSDFTPSVPDQAQDGIGPRYFAYYQKLLAKYDSNQDNVLTEDECSRMSKSPAAADIDEDGKITTTELAKWSSQPRRE